MGILICKRRNRQQRQRHAQREQDCHPLVFCGSCFHWFTPFCGCPRNQTLIRVHVPFSSPPSPHFSAVIFAYVLPSLIWLDGRQSKNSPLFRFHVVIIPCAIVLFQCAFRSVHCLFGNHSLLCAFHWKRNPVSYYGTNTIRTAPIRFSENPNHRRIMQTTANRKASKPFVRLDTFLIGALA